jgi:hypothetical protein
MYAWEGQIPDRKTRARSNLPKEEARERYARKGGLAVLEQIQKDSQLLRDQAIAVGPFARLDAGIVAAEDGKTRGAINNLFGSQAAFQAATMAMALDASDWMARTEFPAPADFADAEAWFDALLTGESERGPAHGAKPAVNDGFLWALWLSAVPYGLWSEQIAKPSLAEFSQTIGRLEEAIRGALAHFGLAMRADDSTADLACATATLIEGVWLNQCLSKRHPLDKTEPAATVLRRSGRMLWRGAVVAKKAR